MRERIDTWPAIVQLGTVIQRPSRSHPGIAVNGTVEGYDVYLPGYCDLDYIGYARYLLQHPRPFVSLHFGKDDL
jgi:hypothetical protein